MLRLNLVKATVLSMGFSFARVRFRRSVAIIGSLVFLCACFSLYRMMESVKMEESPSSQALDDIFVAKILRIEEDLQSNRKTIQQIRSLIGDLARKGGHVDWAKVLEQIAEPKDDMASNNSLLVEAGSANILRVDRDVCSFSESPPPKTGVQMLDVFDSIPFDNLPGGAWKQGFPITYNEDKWKTEKLQVFVIPHSHCDPGWLKTFNQYYQDQVRHILNNMVIKLEEFPRMKFIYAEMSFFSVWWAEIDEEKRSQVRRFINESRFEIVTGGWVMSDEATAHHFSMLDQLIEGNQWLANNVGVKPKSGWAIDPFGQSPTMAYLLRGAGFENMLIQRTHYSIKKYLASTKQLEFAWRQNWDKTGSTDIFCHMMPFYSYDIPHTCGPEPQTCCQFDFRRLDGGALNCPWKVPPVEINPGNVAERAKTLLDQYRKKSELYKHSIVLAPLGDDFRYEKSSEWDQQHNNYIQLFDYMNSQQDWNVEARFATLSEYYSVLRERAAKAAVPDGSMTEHVPPGYPVLAGDFYTYADRDDHYWSGYFTSRPFYKRLVRVLEEHQRAGEILFSLALSEARHGAATSFSESAAVPLMKRLVSARRNLGLFQHHDAVTGTAKDHVVADYGERLVDSLKDLKKIMIDSAQLLLTTDKSKYIYADSAVAFDVDEVRATHDALPVKTVVRLSSQPRTVVFYNSLARNRTAVVRLVVNAPHLEVRDASGQVIPSQVDPIFTNALSDISTDTFKVNFITVIPALGLTTYTVRQTSGITENPHNSFAEITLFNNQKAETLTVGPFKVKTETSRPDDESAIITMTNNNLQVTYSLRWGILMNMILKDSGDEIKTEMQWMKYGTVRAKDRSGAYLFLPGGDAMPVVYPADPAMRLISGGIQSEIHVLMTFNDQVARLINSPGIDGQALEISNLIDIRAESNFELAMRLKTEISNDDFYTDLNGYQMQRRKTLSKLPLQGNYYPMTSAAYIHDSLYRMSVLGAQSLGVASLQQGWLEVMQDRRLDQDDGRGLAQAVHDNKRTPNEFRILVEKRIANYQFSTSQATGYPSLLSHMVSQELVHPIHVLPSRGESGLVKTPAAQDIAVAPASNPMLVTFSPLTKEPPCQVHVLNLRTVQRSSDIAGIVPSDDTALLLHRVSVDCSFVTRGANCPANNEQIILSSLFRRVSVKSAHSASLSLVDRGSIDTDKPLDIPPMEIRAFVIEIR